MKAVVLLFLTASAPAADFDFAVRHAHTFKDCRGSLRFTDAGVEYRASEAKDARSWTYEQILVIQVKSSTAITILTYEDQKRYLGKDRAFEFTLVERKVPADLSAFLLSKVKRPMLLTVLPEGEGKPAFEVRAKHLRTLGGAMGVLRVFEDRVVFQSEKEEDSRIWRLEDIQRFGHPDRFRFQITGYLQKAGGPTETYNFALLDDLPEGLYDYLWVRLNPSSYYPTKSRNH
jgi:hypothetical protein